MSDYIIHSSKGSEWKKHKYIKKILNKTTGLFRYIYDNRKHLDEELEDVENLEELNEKADLYNKKILNDSYKIEFANRQRLQYQNTSAKAKEYYKKMISYNKNKEYAQHYIKQGKAQAERSLKKVGEQKLVLAQKHYEENKAKAKKKVESEYAKTLKLSNIYKVQKDAAYGKEENKTSQKIVNEKANKDYQEKSGNCAYTTIAYELRQRRYDVTAPKANGMTKEQEDAIFNNPKRTYHSETSTSKPIYAFGELVMDCDYFKEQPKMLESQLNKLPNKSRGILSVNWGNGGAHAVVWEKESNKHILVRDTQTNQTYTVQGFYDMARLECGGILDYSFIRTDNADINPKEIQKYIKSNK